MQTGHSRKARMEIRGETIVKCGRPDQIRTEAAKLAAAYELGLSSGQFRAPRLWRHREDGCLEMEYIRDFEPGFRIAAYGPVDHPYWKAVGSALRVVHDRLRPSQCDVPSFPDSYAIGFGRRCWLHGDFNVANVGYDASSGLPVVLDWSLTPMLNSAAGVGPACFDVAWMLRSMFLLPLRLPCPRMLEGKASQFLAAYYHGAEVGFDHADLRRMAGMCIDLTIDMQAPWGIRRYLYTRRADQLRRYLEHEPCRD